jgi:uracil phosphoribosyltransferase
MKSPIILQAADLDGFLTEKDRGTIAAVDAKYSKAMKLFPLLEKNGTGSGRLEARERLTGVYNELGKMMQEIVRSEPNIHVYSFEAPRATHGEASRLIAKLRDSATQRPEFVYYTQRAYELLFNLAFGGSVAAKKNYIFVDTPVNIPVQNYAVHKIPDIDEKIGNSVMCVMLRAALLPSMIVSKEVQEYSSDGYVTPFALFKISRDDKKDEHDMAYILDLKRSYFDLASLNGKDLFFADPMLATGGSLVTIVKYLQSREAPLHQVRTSFRAQRIAASCGPSRTRRSTPPMDPSEHKVYIMPGLGDADRINGRRVRPPRNIIQSSPTTVGISSLPGPAPRDRAHRAGQAVRQ